MKNYIQEGENLPVVVTHPAAPVSGDAVRFGTLTGVAIADKGAGGVAATETMVAFDSKVYDLNVSPVDDIGNSAIVAGDQIYFTDGDAVHLGKKASGYFFGYALEANASVNGTAAVINVLHCPPPGHGTTPADGTVTNAKMAVGAAKANLTTTPATTAELDPTTIQYATVAVTNAQIKGLMAAAKELVAAQATKILEFISATLILDYGANVLTRPNGDENLVVRYTDGTGVAVSEVSPDTFHVAAGDAACILHPAATAHMLAAACVGQALVLDNDGTAEIAGNAGLDTVLRVKIAYRVHSPAF